MKASLKLLLLAGVVWVALNFDTTKRFVNGLISGDHSDSAGAGNGPAPAATPPPPPAAPLVPEANTKAQLVAQSYMRSHAAPGCALSFLDWSNFSTSGQTSTITIRYRVQQPSQADVVASVKFTIQAGNVTKAELAAPASQSPPSHAAQPVAALTPVPVVIDRFTAPIMAAMHGPSMTLQLSDAFSLSQLEQAKAEAQAEKKPLGFVMVWAQLFGHEEGTRAIYGESAMIHFYQVFNRQLVLVFVRHETELGMVPPAVRKGFFGPDEGGYAPNMAVTDATATEFIVEIPTRNQEGPGRDELFAAGGLKIDQWLATHPDAKATPAGNP